MGKQTNILYVHSTINGSSGCDGCELWSSKNRTCFAGNLHENRLAKSLPNLYAPKFTTVLEIPGRFAKAAACQRAKAAGCLAISCQVRKENSGARAFYEKLGFAVFYELEDGNLLVSKGLILIPEGGAR